jgi:hypothetical protein
MSSGPHKRAGSFRLPRWGRSSKRRLAEVKLRGNHPPLLGLLVWLLFIVGWCAAAFCWRYR